MWLQKIIYSVIHFTGSNVTGKLIIAQVCTHVRTDHMFWRARDPLKLLQGLNRPAVWSEYFRLVSLFLYRFERTNADCRLADSRLQQNCSFSLAGYAGISGQPGGRPPGTQGHLQRLPSQMLVKAPGVELNSCNKYPCPWGGNRDVPRERFWYFPLIILVRGKSVTTSI